MGWGWEPHEGFDEQQASDGTWAGGRHLVVAVAVRAACSCGWRGQGVLPLPARPAAPFQGQQASDPEWEVYFAALEALTERCQAEWDVEHYSPILGYEPSELLILGRDGGGPRYFLAGQPVQTGSPLELLMPDGRWAHVRLEVEHTNDPERPWRPVAYQDLGGPAGASAMATSPRSTSSFPPAPYYDGRERVAATRTDRAR